MDWKKFINKIKKLFTFNCKMGVKKKELNYDIKDIGF